MKKTINIKTRTGIIKQKCYEPIIIGDYNAYHLVIEMMDIEAITGTVLLRFVRSDNVTIETVIPAEDVVGNKIYHTMTQQETEVESPLLMYVRFSESNLYTPTLIVFVNVRPLAGHDLTPTEEDEGIIDQIIAAEEARAVWELFDPTKEYKVGNKVSYEGSSYIVHTAPPIGTLPTDTDYFMLIAAKGDPGDVSTAQLEAAIEAHDTDETAHSDIRAEIAQNAYQIKHSTEANAKAEATATGLVITRNVADANPAETVNLQNASSTGNVAEYKFNGNLVGFVDKNGTFGGGVEQTTTKKNKYLPLLKDSAGNVIAKKFTFRWNGSVYVADDSYSYGHYALNNNTGAYSNGFGYYALSNNTGASSNGFGYYALSNNTGANSNGFGYYALKNNTGASSNGFGYYALSNNTGVASNGFGYQALSNNTGAFSNGFGCDALSNNTGVASNGFGYQALSNNTGASSNGFGHYALKNNTGANNNGFGYYALNNNTGASSNGFGYYALNNNTGAFSNGFGYYALSNNTGASSNGFGYQALRYNQKSNNTAIGHNSYGSTFLENSSGDKTCTYTDIDITLERATITAHGFGATDEYVNIKYQATSETAIGGLTVGTIYQIKIIDANTIEFYTGGKKINLTSQGAGTHTFRPQYAYTNVTCLGANTVPNKDNQVVLGDPNVDTVKMGGTARTPASATAPGVKGETCWDTDYFYICVADNSWIRFAKATW